MQVFTRSTRIGVSPGTLFRFHENPRNLRLISPPGMRVLSIEAREKARVGEEFTVDVRQGLLRLCWTGRWEKVEPDRLLVDLGIRCPFVFWRHSHLFEPHGEWSVLTDRVEFRLPWRWGGPAGDLICRWIVFPRMFAARHAATIRLLGPHRG